MGLITVQWREFYQIVRITGWPAVLLGAFVLVTFWIGSAVAAVRLVLILLGKL